ncbi:MAG: hypothetical protein TREMPRED_002168 [Tremellales sp. Tagirdzhanova-0007]|nr:MAG: hypothetical protein TREMPRED_002168 [Tremellales sp. Tagirdzhanova-0007]
MLRITGRRRDMVRNHARPDPPLRLQATRLPNLFSRFYSGFGPTSVPPIRERLKPLIPFFITWSIITSLAVHLLRIRHHSRQELGKCEAQMTVLESMIKRVRGGEVLGDDEMRRDMEMVGLREKTRLTQEEAEKMGSTADVGWRETLLGRKKRRRDAAEEDKRAVQEWAEIMREAIASKPTPLLPSSVPASTERKGMARRAPSAQVYL